MMHILINKLGGCRGAEAEGDVMALFVALFATAADEEYLMERFLRRRVEVFRLYSLGTDGLAVADNGMRSDAASERAGFAEMHLPASSTTSEAFSALVALGLVGRDGGHGELMKMMDGFAQKLFPPQVLGFHRPGAVDATVVSYCSEPRTLLQSVGSAGALSIYDGRLTLAAVRKKKGGIDEEIRLRTLLGDARGEFEERRLREHNAVSPCCLALPDIGYWAKSMVQGFDVARYLNDPAYRRWVMARCRWGADGDTGEQRGCLQDLWPTTYDIASDQEFTRCVQLLEAATTEQEMAAARSAFDEYYERQDVVGYEVRCGDWTRLERFLGEENEADTFFRNQKCDWIGALRTASEADVFRVHAVVAGTRLDDGPLGPFVFDFTKADYEMSVSTGVCCAQMAKPLFEIVGLALVHGLRAGEDLIDVDRRVVEIVRCSVRNFFYVPDYLLLGSTYFEMHVVGPDGRVFLLHRWAPGGYGAGVRLPESAAELRRLKTINHASFKAVQELRVVVKAICDERVAGTDERRARKARTGERPGDAEHVGAVIAAAEEDGTRLPFVNDDGSSVRVFVHPTAKKSEFATVDGVLKTADYLKMLGALPSKAVESEWGVFGDDYGRNTNNNVRALARNRRAVKARYLRKIEVGQELPDVTPDLVWVTVAEMKRLDPSWRDPNPSNTARHGEGRFVVK